MKNVKKRGDIKLVTTEERTNYLVSEPNDHTMISFEKSISNGNEKKSIHE